MLDRISNHIHNGLPNCCHEMQSFDCIIINFGANLITLLFSPTSKDTNSKFQQIKKVIFKQIPGFITRNFDLGEGWQWIAIPEF
jgi:hypothetical protein